MYCTAFETTLGIFALGWTADGLRRVLLPGLTADALHAHLLGEGFAPTDPDRATMAVMDQIEDYADGEAVDFSKVRLDLAGVPDFHRRCYAHLAQVGWGQTLTYGDLARRLGDVGLARAVGGAMGANPLPLIIPCHRVLASDGKPGGFSAPGGAVAKLRMLALEGVIPGTPPGQMRFGF